MLIKLDQGNVKKARIKQTNKMPQEMVSGHKKDFNII